jgi:hypothetical protein
MITETNDPFAALSAPTVRTPRSQETREMTEPKRSWSQPSVLPDIPARDGWIAKWVRTDTYGTPDKTNVSKRMREGWEPIDLGDYPELWTYSGGEQRGKLEVGGLIACRMPAEMVKQRGDHYRGVAKQQESSAEEHYMRDQNELVKKFNENSRKVVFGPGRAQ